MADSYAIPDHTTGGFEVSELYGKAVSWMGNNMVIVLVVALIVLVVFIWAVVKANEHFNPTQNMRFSDSDQYALGKREGLDAGPTRGQSVFAQQTQSTGAPATSASAAAVLSSKDFDCANRKALTSADSWAWLNNQANGPAENFEGNSDNGLSMKLAGL